MIDLAETSQELLTWILGGMFLTFLMFPFAKIGVKIARYFRQAVGP